MKRFATMCGQSLLLNLLRCLTLLTAASGFSTCAAQTAVAASATLPGDSVYLVTATMMDQDGHPFMLAERRGQPMLVSMFYNSCEFVCPMLIDTLRNTQLSLTPEERSRLSMLLITFDPARDDVKVLKSIADKRGLDLTHWTLARTDAVSVRKIAATLGIQYRLLPDGEYNHTTVLVLLDANGRIVGRSKKLGVTDPAFVKQVQEALKAAHPQTP